MGDLRDNLTLELARKLEDIYEDGVITGRRLKPGEPLDQHTNWRHRSVPYARKIIDDLADKMERKNRLTTPTEQRPLITRLRAIEGSDEGTCWHRNPDGYEAAAEIERLLEQRDGLMTAASFLLERLNEFADDNISDGNGADWMGFVEPAMARLSGALTKLENSNDQAS